MPASADAAPISIRFKLHALPVLSNPLQFSGWVEQSIPSRALSPKPDTGLQSSRPAFRLSGAVGESQTPCRVPARTVTHSVTNPAGALAPSTVSAVESTPDGAQCQSNKASGAKVVGANPAWRLSFHPNRPAAMSRKTRSGLDRLTT